MKLGIVDTTFSRVNMGKIALDEIAKNKGEFDTLKVVRKTVPGIKDLPVECALLFENEKCDIVMALGMVGGADIDSVCAHEASSAIQAVMLKHSKHIIEVFVHMKESMKNAVLDEMDLYLLTQDRIRKHVHNAIWLVENPAKLVERAGTGKRQGREDEGEIKG
ncbi:MAG: riboflavin synthase [Candidatus Micrarchaeia archaeon]